MTRGSAKFIVVGRAMAAIAVMAVLLCAAGCSTKKNTPLSRNWQAFTTRYNVYFNGEEHYREQLKDMEAAYEDDYTQRLLTHPAEARANEKLPQPAGNFTRTIEKMQKAIQLHSIKKKPQKRTSTAKDKAFRAREEFNPFLHNAWMKLGKAQFMNGDFLGAASTFFYISRHFKWLPDAVTEALLWQARSYCAMDWNYEAENILTHIKEKQLTSSALKNLYNETMADWLVRTNQYEKAVGYLQDAAKNAKGTQRNRLYFLLGQVCANLGRKQQAYEAYRKAGSGSGISYRAKFNARINRSEVYTGSNIKGEVASLKSMTRYERNREYFDQIYYAIGNLYLSRRDTAQAISNYRKAIKESTRNGINKALAQLALGNILFAQGDYVGAQPCYSEAVPQLPDNYPDYKLLRRRSDVLDELANYAGNVQLQDSLLALSKLSQEEQMKVCQRLADELKKREKEEADSAKRAEYLAQQETQGNANNNSNAPTTYNINNDKSWYFYNTQSKNSGKTEFQKRWGARKLEDDWRRRDKTSYSFNEETNDEALTDSIGSGADANAELTQEQKDSLAQLDDPHYALYYYKNIPHTDSEILTCNDIIQEGLYNMGLILKDKLEDYGAARARFNELLERYPDNIYRLDTYYNMYLMDVRGGDMAGAEKWRRLILDEFPDSPFGKAMQDPNYFENLKRMRVHQEEIYQKAYDAYLADDNNKVHQLTDEMEADYPLSPILPKFVFIDALSYFTQKDYEKFKSRLEYLLDKWPDTDMTDVAGSMLKGIRQGRTLQGGGSNARGLLWEIRLSNDSVASDDAGEPINFDLDPSKPQLLVLAFPRDSVNANQVLYDVARNNFSWFVVRDYDLEPMAFGNIGLLVIKGFANLKELEHYRTVMARENNFDLPDQVRPIMISQANFELLLRQGRSFEEYFRYREEHIENNPPLPSEDETGDVIDDGNGPKAPSEEELEEEN